MSTSYHNQEGESINLNSEVRTTVRRATLRNRHVLISIRRRVLQVISTHRLVCTFWRCSGEIFVALCLRQPQASSIRVGGWRADDAAESWCFFIQPLLDFGLFREAVQEVQMTLTDKPESRGIPLVTSWDLCSYFRPSRCYFTTFSRGCRSFGGMPDEAAMMLRPSSSRLLALVGSIVLCLSVGRVWLTRGIGNP